MKSKTYPLTPLAAAVQTVRSKVNNSAPSLVMCMLKSKTRTLSLSFRKFLPVLEESKAGLRGLQDGRGQLAVQDSRSPSIEGAHRDDGRQLALFWQVGHARFED